MNGYLLDTHVWLWFLRGDDGLGSSARSLIESAGDSCWLSPASIWEAGVLHRRGRISIEQDFRVWIEETRRLLPVRPAPINEEVAVTSFELDLPHQAPVDRFLAATAVTFELVLVTADRQLLASSAVETISART